LLLKILNYTVRAVVVVIGILLLSGIILPTLDIQMRIMSGSIFVLFGIYRLSMYYTQQKRYKFMDEDDEE
jgi:hypothetical protein